MNSSAATRMSDRKPSLIDFNREIIFGEFGSLLAAYAAAFTAAHFTRRATIISASVVAGTLIGGTLFWLAARISNQRVHSKWSATVLASDIGFFTPAAIALGFLVYDPAIFFASRSLLIRHSPVAVAVIVAQVIAFSLFLASMNAYRLILAKTLGKHL